MYASAHHHVYGRDQRPFSWREHYTNILCVCDEHHPPRIITPGGSKGLSWVEDLARQANAHPINHRFVHIYTGPVIYETASEVDSEDHPDILPAE